MRLTALIVTLAAALLSPHALAQPQGSAEPSVTMVASTQRLTLDDELTLQVGYQGKFDEVAFPDVSAFKVVNRQKSNQSFTSITNGRIVTTQSTSYTYQLRPQKAGQLVIGSAAALVGGTVVAKSAPLRVYVTKPKAASPTTAAAARDLRGRANERLFIHAAVPRDRYYVGEPFTINWDIYFQSGVRIEGFETTTQAKLDGLLAEELRDPTTQPQVSSARIGRKSFNKVTVSQQLATPLKPGKVLVDRSVMRISVGERSGRSFFTETKRYTRSSQPFHIEILPVPTEGRPSAFQEGNIGSFSLRATLHGEGREELKTAVTGTRLVLTVTVAGAGNLLTVKAPLIDGGDAFTVQPLPAGADDEIVKDAQGMSGKRTFQYLVTPLSPGQLQSPSASFTYFDPRSGRFETRTYRGQALTVTGEQVSTSTSAAALSGEDVGPIFEHSELEGGDRAPLTASPLYWLLLGLPLAGFIWVESRFRVARSHARNPSQRRARIAFVNAKKRLRAAEQAQKDGLVKDFYGQISRTLIGYLEERANLPATGMTHDEIRRAAGDVGYPAELVDQLIVEMENCDFARFAPSGSATERMRGTFDRTAALLKSMERVTPARRP